MDVKAVPGEEVALQHLLLVCDMMIDMPCKSSANSPPSESVESQRSSNVIRFQEIFKVHVPAVETEAATTTEEI